MRRRRALGITVGALVQVLCCALSLAIGSERLPLDRVWGALAGYDPDAALIVLEQRMLRTLLGGLVGSGLGVDDAVMQAFTRNPLADPGILGVNAGTGLAVAGATAVFEFTSLSATIWFAFIGAVCAAFVVYLIGLATGGPDPLRLMLAGVAIGAFLCWVTSAIVLLLPRVFDQMRGWNAGSIASVPPGGFVAVTPFIVLGLVLALVIAKPLNTLALGDGLATALGSRIKSVRIVSILSVTFVCAAATATAGPIGFVGLMVPHVVRWFTGPDQRWIIGGSMVAAPSLLLASDLVGRVALRSGELPVGIVTAFIGAPVLIILVR
ncbi:MAG: iron chelate uptake ABC transporter family permease subunit [Propionibacteriaceae bacterium]|nr:iron chelate uptake ABC transporter family permease subunit [Propionibacteriaceae bacterium]